LFEARHKAQGNIIICMFYLPKGQGEARQRGGPEQASGRPAFLGFLYLLPSFLGRQVNAPLLEASLFPFLSGHLLLTKKKKSFAFVIELSLFFCRGASGDGSCTGANSSTSARGAVLRHAGCHTRPS
jgi:hypothetical protein